MKKVLENNGYTGKLEVIDEGKVRGQFFATAAIQVASKRKRWTIGKATAEEARAAAEAKASEWFAEMSAE